MKREEIVSRESAGLSEKVHANKICREIRRRSSLYLRQDLTLKGTAETDGRIRTTTADRGRRFPHLILSLFSLTVPFRCSSNPLLTLSDWHEAKDRFKRQQTLTASVFVHTHTARLSSSTLSAHTRVHFPVQGEPHAYTHAHTHTHADDADTGNSLFCATRLRLPSSPASDRCCRLCNLAARLTD